MAFLKCISSRSAVCGCHSAARLKCFLRQRCFFHFFSNDNRAIGRMEEQTSYFFRGQRKEAGGAQRKRRVCVCVLSQDTPHLSLHPPTGRTDAPPHVQLLQVFKFGLITFIPVSISVVFHLFCVLVWNALALSRQERDSRLYDNFSVKIIATF